MPRVREIFVMTGCASGADSIINATILYYKKGKIGDQHEVKEHVRVKIPQDLKSLKVLDEIVRSEVGCLCYSFMISYVCLLASNPYYIIEETWFPRRTFVVSTVDAG